MFMVGDCYADLQTQQKRDPGSLAALAVIRGFSAEWS